MFRNSESTTLPTCLDISEALDKALKEELRLTEILAAIEGNIRRFEDSEKPAYEAWLRLEFGTSFSILSETYDQIKHKRFLITRINALMESHGLHLREALYEVTIGHVRDLELGQKSESQNSAENNARRRAKLQVKRAERKEKKKEKRNLQSATSLPTVATGAFEPQKKVVRLYRALARKLHPDSGDSIDPIKAKSIWLEVQSAYNAKNFERLLAVAAWLQSGSENVGSRSQLCPPTIGELYEKIRALVKSCDLLMRSIESLEKHPGWGFQKTSVRQREKLKLIAKRNLQEELRQAQESLSRLENDVDRMGPPRPPKTRRY